MLTEVSAGNMYFISMLSAQCMSEFVWNTSVLPTMNDKMESEDSLASRPAEEY